MSSWNTKRNDSNDKKAEKNHSHILVLNKSEQKKEHQIQNGNLNHKPAISSTLKSIGLEAGLLDSTVRFSFCVFGFLDFLKSMIL